MITTGIDIIENNRIENGISKLGKRFLEKIYTDNEINYCNNNVQKLSARFAAKEAIFKALSYYLENKYDLGFLNIEILNDKNKRPYVRLINNSRIDKNKNNSYYEKNRLAIENLNKKIESIDISLSHIKEYSIANCVVKFIE